MINTGLDKKFTGERDIENISDTPRSYDPIPEGTYSVRVLEIQPWEKKVKDIYINQRDDKNRLIKDPDGKTVQELVKNVEYYNALMTLELSEGEYQGRRLFTNLTTHPNASFITDNFLYAINAKAMVASEIPTKALNKTLDVAVEISTYEKKITDENTGLERSETRTKNEVKAFRRAGKLDDTDLF